MLIDNIKVFVLFDKKIRCKNLTDNFSVEVESVVGFHAEVDIVKRLLNVFGFRVFGCHFVFDNPVKRVARAVCRASLVKTAKTPVFFEETRQIFV